MINVSGCVCCYHVCVWRHAESIHARIGFLFFMMNVQAFIAITNAVLTCKMLETLLAMFFVCCAQSPKSARCMLARRPATCTEPRPTSWCVVVLLLVVSAY